jgi:uncharacterized membrane protein YoaK (UPF0700 family)
MLAGFLTEIRDTVVPGRDPRHGPLPPLLVVMTMVTGLVDAFSYLLLGHVFVANMTGNVVFLAFALAGAQGFSISASLVALAAFALGALAGGALRTRLGGHRARLLSATAAAQTVLLLAALIITAVTASPGPPGYRYGLIVLLAVSLGAQNAAARTLAVPDLTTTVLTLTITGIAADASIAGGAGSRAGRRMIAVTAMLVGALVGAVLVVHAQFVWPLAIALAAVAAVAAASHLLGRSGPAWTRSPQ